MRKIGVEGGVWALVTEDGAVVELIDAPSELQRDGVRAEVDGSREGAEVSIGMVGDAVRVRRYKVLG